MVYRNGFSRGRNGILRPCDDPRYLDKGTQTTNRAPLSDIDHMTNTFRSVLPVLLQVHLCRAYISGDNDEHGRPNVLA